MYEGAINQAQDQFFCHEGAILVKAPMRLRTHLQLSRIGKL